MTEDDANPNPGSFAMYPPSERRSSSPTTSSSSSDERYRRNPPSCPIMAPTISSVNILSWTSTDSSARGIPPAIRRPRCRSSSPTSGNIFSRASSFSSSSSSSSSPSSPCRFAYSKYVPPRYARSFCDPPSAVRRVHPGPPIAGASAPTIWNVSVLRGRHRSCRCRHSMRGTLSSVLAAPSAFIWYEDVSTFNDQPVTSSSSSS
mmetsp:Transcript_19098/g.45867  ORF Transcript_19098/g.45867 Transcript_19098/m.45867 type:complete len:204 (-) Transcript_19098:508-1119(-)